MNIYLETLLRTLLSIAVLLILCRLDGAKQISQLTFYDYIVGITAGSIAASLCTDRELSIWIALIGIVLFMLSSMLFSFLTNKSIMLRRLITGKPIMLIDQGNILYDGLKRIRFDINDLLRELRSQGYFDITQINYAILESNGMLSVLPKAADRPATAAEAGLTPAENGIKANIIIDGKILKNNLKAMNKDEAWLNGELNAQKIQRIKDILLATLSDKGELNVYLKENGKTNKSLFQ